MSGLASSVVANGYRRLFEIARARRDVVDRLQHRERARSSRRIAEEQRLVGDRRGGDSAPTDRPAGSCGGRRGAPSAGDLLRPHRRERCAGHRTTGRRPGRSRGRRRPPRRPSAARGPASTVTGRLKRGNAMTRAGRSSASRRRRTCACCTARRSGGNASSASPMRVVADSVEPAGEGGVARPALRARRRGADRLADGPLAAASLQIPASARRPR